jgi:hypothetical protein
MNQRLQELLQHATEDILGVPLVNQQKFAELIVLECARKIEDMIDSGWYADIGQLKQHFGVEE